MSRFIISSGQTARCRFSGSQSFQPEKYTLENAPFVGRAPCRRKDGYCQINAAYHPSIPPNNALGLSMSPSLQNAVEALKWRANTPEYLLFKLDWDDMDGDHLVQLPALVKHVRPPHRADEIVDLRIDMPDQGDSSNDAGQRQPHPRPKPRTFTALKYLVLVGFDEGRLKDLPFCWRTSFPALKELWLEGKHTLEDIRIVLEGCPQLEKLTISTITDSNGAGSGMIVHESLTKLIFVSNIPMNTFMGSLKFPALHELELWMMPDIASGMNKAAITKLLKSAKSVNKDTNWTLRLNIHPLGPQEHQNIKLEELR